MKRLNGCVLLLVILSIVRAELCLYAAITENVDKTFDTGMPLEAIEKLISNPGLREPEVSENIDSPDIKKLIENLGASEHKVRVSAGKDILKIGKPAEAWLRQAAQSDDPEISFRAKELLKQIKDGIRPSSPPDLAQLVQNYEKLSWNRMARTIDYVCKNQKNESVPFLLNRIQQGSDREAEYIVKKIKSQKKYDENTLELILKYSRELADKRQEELFAFASIEKDDIDDMVKALKCKHLGDGTINSLISKCVKKLTQLVLNFEHKKVKKYAKLCADAAPNDARFLYLQSTVYESDNNERAARKLRKKALSLNDESEPAHYQAGELLMELGHYQQAALEWQKILTIPPEKGVYDINAHFRLGRIYHQSRMYGKAADEYETGLRRYQEARRGSSGMGMTVSVETIENKIKHLRQHQAEENIIAREIQDDPAIRNIYITTDTVVKDGKKADMDKALSKALISMSVSVQPYGVRIFEEAKAYAKYDPEKKQIDILMNGSPTTKPYLFEIESENATVAIRSLDMCYIYKVNGKTGDTTLLESYDVDYIFKARLGPDIAKLKDVTITMNDNTHTTEALSKGIKIDFLPKKFDISIKGRTKKGDKVEMHRSLTPKQMISGKSDNKEPVAIRIQLEVVR